MIGVLDSFSSLNAVEELSSSLICEEIQIISLLFPQSSSSEEAVPFSSVLCRVCGIPLCRSDCAGTFFI